MRCPMLSELPKPLGKTGWPWTQESPQQHAQTPDGQPWPRITVVTISYNQGKFIEEAIRSILLQGYPDLEYIIIDGGSTDGTVEIVKKYQRSLGYWCSEPDHGPASALNRGFRHATGEILGYLNSDDLYLPGCFQRIAKEFHERQSIDVAYGNGYLADSSIGRTQPMFSDRWNSKRFAYGACVLVQQATFFRRAVFEETRGFNEKNQTCWDGELWADLGLAGVRFQYLDEFLGAFRIYDDSISGSGRLDRERRRDQERIFEKIMGRPGTGIDRLYGFAYRFLKFSRHPQRALGYRSFFRSVLQREAIR